MRAWLVVLLGCSGGHDPASAPAARPLVPETCTPARLEEATLDECEQHCRDGSGVACAVAAHKRCSGIAMRQRDVPGCLTLALRGCELGARDACDTAALVYSGTQDGRARDDDHEDQLFRRYIELSDRDCTGGDGEACLDLVFFYDRKDPGTTPWLVPDHERAMKYLARGLELAQQACDRGNAWACHKLAIETANGNALQQADIARSRELDRRACELGHGESCYLSDDPALLRHGCDLGNAASCSMLAIHVRHDQPDEAARLRQRACELGRERDCAIK